MTKMKFDKRVWMVVAVIVFIVVIYGLRNNPVDGQEKLDVMRRDMDVILMNGGVVAVRSQSYKYGAAYLYVGVDAKSWSPELADKYSRGLVDIGWREVNSDEVVILCKKGISAEVQRGMERGDGKAVYGINMTYNALTIRRCKAG
ncbi:MULTISPECIES: hypothetical protein [Burkholderia]|uniref:Uncharacterized protein n=1 Tax=Burkholderia anthinoferrum TaxID=3090833 RepID=A0ABU5WXZ9_9BURK|nr:MULTISPECIES: hypothetical protein [Burkholderia]MEB2504442.1 hypothetical protein [Burkholderia anthinoferrum]MEB2534352.1 hypothetical protein [Burkholderia anthinoferrum]MEB2559464.1 hypothetical protein [Burkholderia anthinoferrum]MEB2583910.1 hypothetical protein [Burkholderia anthinoferrum]MCA8105549.1 hypothetical protein [Burkholderia sp. AU36459]